MAKLQRNDLAGNCAACCRFVDTRCGFYARRKVLDDAGELEAPEPRRCIVCDGCARALIGTGAECYPLPPNGYYAVTSHGSNDLIFLKFKRLGGKGNVLCPTLKLVVGGHPDANIDGPRAFDLIGRIVREGVSMCALRYSTELGRCSRCNRTLTDEASRARGLGPECAAR